MTPFRDRYVDVCGVRTRFWKEGDSGPVVILIHGLGASAEHWTANVKPLASRFRVFVPDLPGFGRSAKPDYPAYTPDLYSDFLLGFMTALDIDRASLAGHSMGGGVSLHACLKRPERVERLVLIDSAGLGRKLSLMLRLASLPWTEHVLFKPPYPVFVRFLHRLVYRPEAITEDFGRLYYELFFQPGTIRAFSRIIRALCTLEGARDAAIRPILERLGSIAAPTLVIWGREDRVLPVEQAYVAAQGIPNAQLEIIEHCGHMPIIEYPEKVNELLLSFLAGEPTASE